MTSIQTTVDDDIADAFTAWANENYKSKAAALRDYIKKAPKGESVHSATTNEDLEDQIENLRETIESGSFSVHQQNQQQSGAESSEEDVDPIDMYDPELEAEDLPAEITPKHDDASCISKDILEQIVDEWEETSSVPELNPTHISSDHRPQGGDTPVALGLGIIKHRYNKKISYTSIVDVLSADNGGLGYTEQYVKENGHAHDVADNLVTFPGETTTYIVDEDLKFAALEQIENDIETELSKMRSCDRWTRFKWAVENLEDALEDLQMLENELDVSSDLTTDEVNDEVVSAGAALGKSRFDSEMSDAQTALDGVEEQLDELESATSIDQFVAAKSVYGDIDDAIESAENALSEPDRYDGVPMEDWDRAEDTLDRAEELMEEYERIRDEKKDMLIELEKEGLQKRVTGVEHLADIAIETEGLSVAESTVDAIDDLHDYKYNRECRYADLTVGLEYKNLRSQVSRQHYEISSRSWSVI